MKLLFKRKSGGSAGQVDLDRLPRHIAIILDGNGRWAQRRGLPRTAGHKAGAETFRTIATYCRDIGLEYLTVYAFSTENWKRSRDEVSTIMALLKKYLLEAIETMERDNVRLRFMGDLAPLDQELRDLIAQCNAISERLTGCLCSICINYGGRAEIVRGHPQSGAPHPSRRRAAAEQLPALAVRLRGVLLHPRALARLYQGGAPQGHRRLPTQGPALWRGEEMTHTCRGGYHPPAR